MTTYRFEHVDTKNELMRFLNQELPKFGFRNVKVLTGDPTTPAELPCIGINRLDDSESNQSIGDMAGEHYDEKAKVHYRTHGTYFQESLELRIWHTNAGERDKLYRHLKAILIAIRMELVKRGLRNLTLRSGKDEQDSTGQNAPVPIYWSTITLSAMNPLDVTFEEIIEPISAIAVNADVFEGANEGGVLGE